MTLKRIVWRKDVKKTNLSDLGSYYCSPSFFRTWSRKLAINMFRSLLSILSNSLGSFLETQNFFNNETSLCVLLNVVLFSWCYTNPSKEQPTDKPVIVFLRPTHFLKKNSEAPLKGRQFWKAICQRMNHSDWPRNAFTLSLIGYAFTCENSCTPFSELRMTGCI